MRIPNMDPSFFIKKFCMKLFKDDDQTAKLITKDAFKILRSMNWDWISTGRWPQGLCGCAILLASWMHGLNISLYDVCKVIRVSPETVKIWMAEFSQTENAKLTSGDFKAINSN